MRSTIAHVVRTAFASFPGYFSEGKSLTEDRINLRKNVEMFIPSLLFSFFFFQNDVYTKLIVNALVVFVTKDAI